MEVLLANGRRKFFINCEATFTNGPRNLSKNPLDCIIFDVSVFVNYKLTDKSFAMALRKFPTSVLVS